MKNKMSMMMRMTAVTLGLVCGLVGSAQAGSYFWDNNGTTDGFGVAGGTWGTDSYWNDSNTGGSGAFSATITTSDIGYFGTDAYSYGLGAGTITVGTVNASNLVFGSQSGAITLSGGTITLGSTVTITVNNSSNSISSKLAGAATGIAKSGTGEVILSGTNTFVGTLSVPVGTVTLSCPGANTGGGSINVGNGSTGQTGVLNINSGTVASSSFYIGASTGRTGIVNQAGGAVSSSGTFGVVLGNANGAGTATYNMTGGTLTSTITMGLNAGDSAANPMRNTFNLSGTGYINAPTKTLSLGRGGVVRNYISNTYSQTGGTAIFGTLSILPGNGAANNTGIFSVTGGTFSATTFSRLGLIASNANTVEMTIGGTAIVTLPAFPTNSPSTTATLTFDGGTLVVGVSTNNYIQAGTFDTATITGNGATIDTGANSAAIAQVFQGVGGITKSGTGTLTLTGVNTYSGVTTVSNGTLQVGCDNAVSSNGSLTVVSGATLDVAGYQQTLTGAVDLKGTFMVTVAEDGSCGKVSTTGALDLTGATLSVANPAGLNKYKPYVVLTYSTAPTGMFSDLSLPPGWKTINDTANNRILLRAKIGTMVSFL